MTKRYTDYTDAEIDNILGHSDRDRTYNKQDRWINRLPEAEQQAREEMPDAASLVQEQVTAAIYRIHENMTKYPQFPWKGLADLSGPMCPEDLIMVAARTGGGKSLFLQNLFDSLICSGHYGLYVSRAKQEILRTKWACLRHDVPPRLLLATRPDERDGEAWQRGMDLVQQDFKWQLSPEIKAKAHFAAARKINAAGLKRWTLWAIERGCQFIIVDHIDRVQHGDGKNSFHEVSETIRLAKELASEHRIVMILASQVGRPGDPLEQFMPPALHNMRGAGTKEEEADTVLGIYRPLRLNVNEQELKQVRQGVRGRDDVIEPNVMGVMLLKHRLDGPVAGKIVKLSVKHQKVSEMVEKDRWSTDDHFPRQIV